MADERPNQSNVSSRPVDLAGDSAELIAFALLRYLAQIEQQQDDTVEFDRVWMLDAYAECLEAAQGKRVRSTATSTNKPRSTSRR